MRDVLDGLDSDGWWFLNPETFILAFRSSNSGDERAQACMTVLRRLANSVASLAKMAVGGAQGDVLCNLADAGHLDTPPLGEVVNEAYRQARKNAS